MVIIGLTGGIASGKTTISNCLQAHGAVVLDADKISRELTQKGNKGALEIEKEFGARFFIDGNLNRQALADEIFKSEEKTRKLNAIIHRLVIERINELIAEYAQKGCKAVIIDAPLLIESNLHKMCHEVWVVVADEEKRIDRAMKRSGLNRDQAIARIRRQLPDSEKVKVATAVIDNNADEESACRHAVELYEKIINQGGNSIGKETFNN